MRVGLFLVSAGFPGQSHTEVLERTVTASIAAESAGFDSVWVAEHHFMSYGLCPAALTLAGHLLGRTTRISVGTAVSVLTTQHPMAVAEQANLLDQVSNGRFRLGVGRGGPWVDLEVFGTGLARYSEGFDEAVELLLRALRGGRVDADGQQFRFREVAMVPEPRTLPRLPVTLAATSEQTLALAAHHGLGLLLGMHQTAQEQATMLRRYRELTPPGGTDGAEHVVTGVAHVADSVAEARREVCAWLPAWLGPGLAGYRPLDGHRAPRRDVRGYTQFLIDTHAVGDPEHCAAKLDEQRTTTGAAEVVLLVETTGERRATLDNIARLGAQVLPRLRTRVSSPQTPGTGSTVEPGV